MIYYQTWKKIITIVILFTGILFASPNFMSDKILSSLPSWFPHKQVNLGLDLQGGSYLLLKVELSSIYKGRYQDIKYEVRNKLRKVKPTIHYLQLRSNSSGVSFQIKDKADYDRALKILQPLLKNLSSEHSNDGKYTIKMTDKEYLELEKRALSQSIEIIRRRVDSTGTKEPIIQRQGADRIILQLPGISDSENIKHLLGRTANLSFHLVSDKDSNEDTMILPMNKGDSSVIVNSKVEVSGADLIKADATFSQGSPVVSFSFNSSGARKFFNITKDNIGKQLAIVLDGEVISAPRINSAINGQGIIQGNFTVKEADELSLLLRAGALPAPLTVVEERTVGAGLGQDSIVSGEIASTVGCILVIVFMLVTYRLFGFFATIALAINLILIIGLLSLFQATLTLPGIAGLVLTMGMAVDANVLIFERIREDLLLSYKIRQAITTGYEQALSTILDANITTLIATLLLYNFGTGPVKGFAVTLSIGVITSMFCALMLSRFMIYSWFNRRRPRVLDL